MPGSKATPAWKELFDGGVAIAAPLGPEELASIPAKRGVFLLEGPAETPILLATAANIRSRMRHRLAPPDEKPSKRVDLREVAAHLRWKLAHSHFETDWQFLELARAIYPDTYAALLSFQPAWFVHIHPADACPWFRRTKEVFAASGQYFGPFRDKHAAQRFIEVIQDVFDLCRCEQVLRQAPTGTPCVYAQMGRCSVPCAGGITMDEYRAIVAGACRCAAGDREGFRSELLDEMSRLAERRQYEQAADCKARLARLGELDSQKYQHAAPAGQFAYLLVQRGPRRGKANTFFVDRGAIRRGPILDYPLAPEQLEAALAQMRAFVAEPRRPGRVEREGIGLVTHYLFTAKERRGLSVHYGADLTAGRFAEAISSAAEELTLKPLRRKPSRREGKADAPTGSPQ